MGALSLVAAAVPALRAVVVAADVLFVALVVVDAVTTPSPRRFVLERALPDRAGLDVPFARELAITSRSRRSVPVEVHEEFPADVDVVRIGRGNARTEPDPGDPSGGPDRAMLAPGEETRLVRDYVGRVRGVRVFGSVRVVARGRLGLSERTARLAGRQAVAIEPPLVGLRRTLALAASERLDAGARRAGRRGGMTEFESLRDYVHGDDVRLVDWKAFAKRGHPAVREYQEERGQELVLLVDCGRRMAATTTVGERRGWTKLDHALDTALILAAVALTKGDRVGLLAFDAEVRTFVPPRRGTQQLARLRDASFDLTARLVTSDLARALAEVGVRHRRRATLIVLSDVADPLSIDEQRRALAGGSRRHAIVFCALDDPAVRELARTGRFGSAAERAAALALVEDRRAGLRALARSGARVLDALPAEGAARLVAAWLEARAGVGFGRATTPEPDPQDERDAGSDRRRDADPEGRVRADVALDQT